MKPFKFPIYLLFIDVTFVCESSLDQRTYQNWLLICFEVIFSLRVEFTISELILVRRVENFVELAMELCFNVGVLPFSYLGLPVDAPFN